MANLSRQEFVEAARGGGAQTICIPLVETLLADQVTPVLAYRRLVSRDPRTAPSFLFESVEGGERQGRYSIMGAQPSLRVRASATRVQVDDLRTGQTEQRDESDPLAFLRSLAAGYRLCRAGPGLPGVMLGGWVGYAAYDAARYDEPEKLAFDRAPRDDRNLPDLEFAFYDGVVILDHARQVVHVVTLGRVPPGAGLREIEAAYDAALARLASRVVDLQTHSRPLPLGRLGGSPGSGPLASNLSRAQHAAMVERAKEYIRAGDVF